MSKEEPKTGSLLKELGFDLGKSEYKRVLKSKV